MSTLAIEHVEPAFSAAVWGSLMILVWRDDVEPRHLYAAHEIEQRIVSGNEGTLSVLNIYPSEHLVRMSEQTRTLSAGLLHDLAPKTIAQAHVVPDLGRDDSPVRSFIESVWELSKITTPHQMFADIDAALRWLVQRPEQDPLLELYRDQLATAVRAFAAAPPDPHTALPTSTASSQAAAECPNVSRCPMYPELDGHRVLKVFQNLYCRHDYPRCARYRSMSGGVIPSSRLLPNGATMPSGDGEDGDARDDTNGSHGGRSPLRSS